LAVFSAKSMLKINGCGFSFYIGCCTILKISLPQPVKGAIMDKIDLKKEYKNLYNPSAKEVSVVEVPSFNYLMIDGQGNPNTSQEYVDAIQTLYPVAYTLKFMVKKGKQAVDYGVMPLEGLWWADNMDAFTAGDKDKWSWTAMIMQPAKLVTAEMVKEAVEQVKKKNPPALSKLRFEKLDEGSAVQMMHIGPYAEETANIQKLHSYIKQNGYELAGKHHEIYLSDPRKTAPEKLKTVVRQPFKKK